MLDFETDLIVTPQYKVGNPVNLNLMKMFWYVIRLEILISQERFSISGIKPKPKPKQSFCHFARTKRGKTRAGK